MKHSIESIHEAIRLWPMQGGSSQAWHCLSLLSRWCALEGMQAYLCGGAIRDVVIKGPEAEIKDLDIMIDASMAGFIEDICSALGYNVLRDTLLGGVKVITPLGTIIDLWYLKDSYGITEPSLESYLESVPTNIESVTLNLRTGEIQENGFLEAINTQTITPMFNKIPRDPRWMH